MFSPTTVPNDAFVLQLLPIMVEACQILAVEYQRYCSGKKFHVQHKADHSPVTQADLRIHQYIAQQLAIMSDLPLLSEEGNLDLRQQWSEFWLLDPLDGTKEFLHQRDEFTINLSLVEHGQTTLAFLAVPAQQLIYICPRQGMPLKFDVQRQQWWLYQPSVEPIALSTIHVALSHSRQQHVSYQQYLAQLAHLHAYDVVQAGSAYKFCMMLETQVDLYPRFHPTCEWDTSAGQCFLERIGGGVIDLHGRAFIYNQRTTLLNGDFIAYRNEIVKQIALAALAPTS